MLLALRDAFPADWSPKWPVRMIVPFLPGGAVDSVARIIVVGYLIVSASRWSWTPWWRERDHRLRLAAGAPADGHTILIVPAGHDHSRGHAQARRHGRTRLGVLRDRIARDMGRWAEVVKKAKIPIE